jgi:hypothetical protein
MFTLRALVVDEKPATAKQLPAVRAPGMLIAEHQDDKPRKARRLAPNASPGVGNRGIVF